MPRSENKKNIDTGFPAKIAENWLASPENRQAILLQLEKYSLTQSEIDSIMNDFYSEDVEEER